MSRSMSVRERESPYVYSIATIMKEDLGQYHTRQLLQMRHTIRREIEDLTNYDGLSGYYGIDEKEWPPGLIQVRDARVRLYAELATREHIPNAVEAKELRRQKAKAQRNR